MSSASPYQQCVQSLEDGGDTIGAMDCLATEFEQRLEQENAQLKDEMTSWLLILCGSLVFFMQAGFAMVCAGAVRKKNL